MTPKAFSDLDRLVNRWIGRIGGIGEIDRKIVESGSYMKTHSFE